MIHNDDSKDVILHEMFHLFGMIDYYSTEVLSYSRRESNSCRFQRGIFTPAVVTFPCNTAV